MNQHPSLSISRTMFLGRAHGRRCGHYALCTVLAMLSAPIPWRYEAGCGPGLVAAGVLSCF